MRLHSANAAQRHDNLLECLRPLPKGALVRHLVSGDLFHNDQPDHEAIQEIRQAHQRNPHVLGWGYTHGWSRLQAEDLNLPNLTFNASCDNPAQVRQALAAGWPAVTVVSQDAPRFTDRGDYVQVVCPEQYLPHVTCQTCRLCTRKNRTYRGKPVVVAFRAHGAQKKTVDRIAKENQQ